MGSFPREPDTATLVLKEGGMPDGGSDTCFWTKAQNGQDLISLQTPHTVQGITTDPTTVLPTLDKMTLNWKDEKHVWFQAYI